MLSLASCDTPCMKANVLTLDFSFNKLQVNGFNQQCKDTKNRKRKQENEGNEEVLVLNKMTQTLITN